MQTLQSQVREQLLPTEHVPRQPLVPAQSVPESVRDLEIVEKARALLEQQNEQLVKQLQLAGLFKDSS